jgi:hypothetical protein
MEATFDVVLTQPLADGPKTSTHCAISCSSRAGAADCQNSSGFAPCPGVKRACDFDQSIVRNRGRSVSLDIAGCEIFGAHFACVAALS